MTVRRAVVTSLLGGYETLGSQPVAAVSDADFLCFTDDPELVGGDWHVVVCETPFPLDPSRSQRWFKIVGHPMLDDYDEVLYIDNSVRLTADPSPTMQVWLDGVDLASIEHSFRETVLDEFDAVLLAGLDDPARVHEQLLHYSLLYPDALRQRPSWNGMFAYRPGARVREVMTRWYGHVLRYSRRDQLSWNVVVPASGLRLRRIPLDNHHSELHEWPVEVSRVRGASASSRPIGPLVVDLQPLDRELRDAQSKLGDESARLAAAWRDRDEARAAATQAAAATAAALQEVDAVRHTVSWRVTAPLRGVRRVMRGDR